VSFNGGIHTLPRAEKGRLKFLYLKLTAMGHEVKLLPDKVVKLFVTGNKNDRHERAIWMAMRQPGSIGGS